jgi:glyceraldehyde 3-phosphate dehydrogenase
VEKMGVDVVIESTGLFTDAEKSKGHMAAGAKKVIISAPAKGEDITVVMGVNHEKYDPAKHNIISNASCTTNCLAPLVHVLAQGRFRHRGRFDDDDPFLHRHAKDRGRPEQEGLERRTQRGHQLIPSTTGAAKAVGLVCPK